MLEHPAPHPGHRQVYDEVQVDGIYLRSGWCALIAIAGGQVIGWQWCDLEKQASWDALLARFPASRVVVTDGQAGILAAVTAVLACHPGATLPGPCPAQRAYLPHPATAHRCRAHAARVVVVPDEDHHPRRSHDLVDPAERRHQAYGHLTRQRTYRHTVHTAAVPSWTRPWQTWYTHDRLRKAYRLLAKLARKDVLFTYLDPKFDGLGISSTTNQIEGGINASSAWSCVITAG